MFCPKCHRPTEDGEAYICCGNASLTWRCTECAKVSEGFAFPYGLCPYCSGKLEIVSTDGPAASDTALEAIRTAFEIELGGHAFYTRASQEAETPELQALFGKFAEMEGEHMETLARRYHADPPTVSDRFRLDRAAVFAGLDTHPGDPANLFRLAIAFEERAVAFFTAQSESLPEDAPERLLYRELAAEEREHVAILQTELDRWQDGKPGLM